MKEPIKPEDIRIGDHIRSEARKGETFADTPLLASEWIVREEDLAGDFDGVDLYLLDRPNPAVDLPTEPTLAWAAGPRVHAIGSFSGLGFWDLGADSAYLNRTSFTHPDGKGNIHLDASKLTAFTPATAVPTEALDRLREYAANSEHSMLLQDFLAAVDAANGDHA